MKRTLISVGVSCFFLLLLACTPVDVVTPVPTATITPTYDATQAAVATELTNLYLTAAVLSGEIKVVAATATFVFRPTPVPPDPEELKKELNAFIQNELEEAFGIGREVVYVDFDPDPPAQYGKYELLTIRIACKSEKPSECLSKQIAVDFFEALQEKKPKLLDKIPPDTARLEVEIVESNDSETRRITFRVPWAKVHEFLNDNSPLSPQEFHECIEIFTPTPP